MCKTSDFFDANIRTFDDKHRNFCPKKSDVLNFRRRRCFLYPSLVVLQHMLPDAMSVLRHSDGLCFFLVNYMEARGKSAKTPGNTLQDAVLFLFVGIICMELCIDFFPACGAQQFLYLCQGSLFGAFYAAESLQQQGFSLFSKPFYLVKFRSLLAF